MSQGLLCLHAMSKGEVLERDVYSAPTDNLVEQIYVHGVVNIA